MQVISQSMIKNHNFLYGFLHLMFKKYNILHGFLHLGEPSGPLRQRVWPMVGAGSGGVGPGPCEAGSMCGEGTCVFLGSFESNFSLQKIDIFDYQVQKTIQQILIFNHQVQNTIQKIKIFDHQVQKTIKKIMNFMYFIWIWYDFTWFWEKNDFW